MKIQHAPLVVLNSLNVGNNHRPIPLPVSDGMELLRLVFLYILFATRNFYKKKNKVEIKQQMYYTLDQMNRNSSAKISDKKYSCPNYIAPDTKNYYNYFNLPSTQNTNVNELPFYQVSQDKKLVFPAESLPPIQKELVVVEEKDSTNTSNDEKQLKMFFTSKSLTNIWH